MKLWKAMLLSAGVISGFAIIVGLLVALASWSPVAFWIVGIVGLWIGCTVLSYGKGA